MSSRLRPGFYRALPATAVLCIVAGLTVANASTVRRLNLEQMTERAATIFTGRCVEVRSEIDPTLGLPITAVTFEIDRTLKGETEGTITVKLVDDARLARSGPSVTGQSQFREGEDVVLFLYGTSRLGFTSPIGLGQGKFDVLADKSGGRIAVNAFGNRGLLDALSPEARSLLGARSAEWKRTQRNNLDDLLAMIDALSTRLTSIGESTR